MNPCGWEDCPEAVRAQVAELVQACRLLLAHDLIGVYLHGSLAMGCFNPTRSDVDLLVLVRRRLNAVAKRGLAGLLLRLSNMPRPIEISVLNAGDLRPWRHPAPFDFHFGEDWREKIADDLESGEWANWSDAPRADPDLAAHLTVTLARGLNLHGPPPPLAFPNVPGEDYLDSIVSDFEWALERLGDDPAYFVLNACRVLAFVNEGRVLSKDEGGAWALSHLPLEQHGLIRAALAVYRGVEEHLHVETEVLEQFAALMRQRIKK